MPPSPESYGPGAVPRAGEKRGRGRTLLVPDRREQASDRRAILQAVGPAAVTSPAAWGTTMQDADRSGCDEQGPEGSTSKAHAAVSIARFVRNVRIEFRFIVRLRSS